MWVEVDGRFAIGEGGLDLLAAIAAGQSLTKAARHVGWSYRHAWGYLRHAEEVLGITLTETLAGKGELRGMSLTSEGQALLATLTTTRDAVRRTGDAVLWLSKV